MSIQLTCPVRFIALSFSLAPAINYGFDNVMAGSFRYMAVVRGGQERRDTAGWYGQCATRTHEEGKEVKVVVWANIIRTINILCPLHNTLAMNGCGHKGFCFVLSLFLL